MKEAIIYLLFDNWCNSGHEPEVIEAMKKAIQNPTEDTIFELSSVVEANAFKAGVRSCLQMIHCLFIEGQEIHMLEKLYELWSIEKRVSVTIKSVGLNCTFTTVI